MLFPIPDGAVNTIRVDSKEKGAPVRVLDRMEEITPEDALREAQQAISLWIETAKEFGDPIPSPKGRRLVFA